MNTERVRNNEKLILDEAFKTAMQAAIKASDEVLKYWPAHTNPHFDRERVLEIIGKEEGTGNYATIADLEAEKIIIDAIKANPLFTTHAIIAEESDIVEGSSGKKWVIDPIDGTGAFRHGLVDFGINIGLIDGQNPAMGVIALPAYRLLIGSVAGKGAHLYDFEGNTLADLTEQNKAINEDTKEMLVAYDTGYVNRGDHLTNYAAKIADKIGYPISYASCAAGNFRLAQGSLAAYFLPNPKIFDIAAPAAIISEIGGKVTNIKGGAIDWDSKNLSYLAARNPQIHGTILEMFES